MNSVAQKTQAGMPLTQNQSLVCGTVRPAATQCFGLRPVFDAGWGEPPACGRVSSRPVAQPETNAGMTAGSRQDCHPTRQSRGIFASGCQHGNITVRVEGL